MQRRTFLSSLGAATMAGVLPIVAPASEHSDTVDDRSVWLDAMLKIVRPVLAALAAGKLHEKMPVEHHPRSNDRHEYTYLEAFGRTMTGIAPWLELDGGPEPEVAVRNEMRQLALAALAHAVDPGSPDRMNFDRGGQPLVDAAFLSHALLRAPEALVDPLDSAVRSRLIEALQSTRRILPVYSNWLLFSAMVEAALARLEGAADPFRIDIPLRKFDEWYLGDGHYGDGPEFHWDYYNSFVIQPFMLDILKMVRGRNERYEKLYQKQLAISRRYAEIQERLIAPDGTFPPIGRSIAYRFGAFQLLAQMALWKELPENLAPAAVRGGLTAVIRKVMSAPGTFDEKDWLRIGLYGSQPGLGETYISTGSLYLCTAVFLPLGLPATDPFWADRPVGWTSLRIWSGEDFPADHALSLED